MNKIGLCLVGFLIAQLLVFSQAAVAQRVEKTRLAENEVAGPTSAANVTTNETPDVDTYQIGPGDILEIRVFNRPQLSREAVRVDARGMIRVPLIEEGIRAACRTETELAKELGKRYLEYLRNPSIEVFVKEFQSQPVAVLGAVVTPGRFQLQRRVRLLELLSYAGGP
ncbi:MAG TPA: polysaccharide biosynthesis/export family protein, partial [Pyrinomonadaceae bacterium]|nr:polysaccharide biosynthesis/export family protein [Pyrinomonadaceae bacterium]